MEIIDPELESSWPPELRAAIDELDELTPTTEHASDLEVGDAADYYVRRALSEGHLRAYHATKLLPHEPALIRRTGLRPFSRQLFDDRICGAFEAGAFSEVVRDKLLAAHMYAVGEEKKRGDREGAVCCTLLTSCFLDGTGSSDLLSYWGGEGLYFSRGAREHQELLRHLGRPAIIVVAIPVLRSSEDQQCWPDLAKVLLGVRRRIDDGGADLFHHGALPPEAILEVWQPGDQAYDRYPRLARD